MQNGYKYIQYSDLDLKHYTMPKKTTDTKFHSNKPFGLTIGPQRSGTTWVDRYLRSRGDVCLPHQVKETFYFDKNYNKGHDFYKNHFAPEEQHSMIIEVSATAFDHPDAPKRVFDMFGNNLKMVCPLRHPVPRSYSLYRHFLQYGIVREPLDNAIEQKPSIITSSFYAKHLENWYKVFGQNAIEVIFLEELRLDPENFTKKLCDGFGLPYKPALGDMRRQKNNYAVKPPHPLLAKFGQTAADTLRDINAYALVNLAKRMGLKRVFFGTGKREEDVLLTIQEHELLMKNLEEEVIKLEALLGYEIESWKDYKLRVENINEDSAA